MRRTIRRRSRQALVPFTLFVACVLAPGCGCDLPARALASTTIPCIVHDETVSAVKSTGATTIVPGGSSASLSFPQSGGVALDVDLDVAEGHGAPAAALLYESANIEDNGAGVGVSIKGVDAVTRCPRTTVMDGENREVCFDKLDAYRYPLKMAPSKTTGLTLLQSVQQCAGDNKCTAGLRLMYAQPNTGFEVFTTTITAMTYDLRANRGHDAADA